ncbi:hypothetical protein [Altererythrobacter xiamenensis]|uniref:hypothetical protein n=1 Tax=Altererythrobacter xiamenensis TaxID=1316679 RepID=UPI0011784A1F|nr:hypothetical protein [Altererythrobacter xiamenensis]
MRITTTAKSRSQTELRLGIGLAGLFVIGCFVAAIELVAGDSRVSSEPQEVVRVARTITR